MLPESASKTNELKKCSSLASDFVKELERLKECEETREDLLQQLAYSNRLIKERLKMLEANLLNAVTYNSEEVERKCDKTAWNADEMTGRDFQHNKSDHLMKTFARLTRDCFSINKKFMYLKRLIKLNNQKLKEMESQAERQLKNTKTEDKFCQVILDDDRTMTSSALSRRERYNFQDHVETFQE